MDTYEDDGFDNLSHSMKGNKRTDLTAYLDKVWYYSDLTYSFMPKPMLYHVKYLCVYKKIELLGTTVCFSFV